MVASGGNPMGAALGSGLGSLLSGGSMQDAFPIWYRQLPDRIDYGQGRTWPLNALGGSSPQSQGARVLGHVC